MFVRVLVFTCILVYMRVCNRRPSVFVFVYVCVHVCMFVRVLVFTCMFVYVCVYACV